MASLVTFKCVFGWTCVYSWPGYGGRRPLTTVHCSMDGGTWLWKESQECLSSEARIVAAVFWREDWRAAASSWRILRCVCASLRPRGPDVDRIWVTGIPCRSFAPFHVQIFVWQPQACYSVWLTLWKWAGWQNIRCETPDQLICARPSPETEVTAPSHTALTWLILPFGLSLQLLSPLGLNNWTFLLSMACCTFPLSAGSACSSTYLFYDKGSRVLLILFLSLTWTRSCRLFISRNTFIGGSVCQRLSFGIDVWNAIVIFLARRINVWIFWKLNYTMQSDCLKKKK